MSIIPHRNLIILCILFAAPLRVDLLSSAEPIPEVAMHQIGEDIPTPAAFERAQVVIVARVERVGEAQLGPPGSTRIAGTQVKTLMSFKGGRCRSM